MIQTRPPKVWSRLLLLAILCLSAWIQLTVVARTTSTMPMVSDAADYFSYAYNLKHSGIYSNTLSWASEASPDGVIPSALRSPGYPLFLLLVPGVSPTGDYLHRVALIQAGLAVLSVLLVFLIGRRFLPGYWPHLAALITAISPHLANLTTYVLTETLFLFVLLVSISFTLLATDRKSRWLFLASGVSWGLCALVRPAVLPLPFAVLALSLVVSALRVWRPALLLVCAGVLLAQAPWLIRNQVVALDRSEGSLMVGTLHHGSYPNFLYRNIAESYGWPFRFDPASERAERDLPSVMLDIAQKFREQPVVMTRWYLLGKPGYFLSWGYVQGKDIYVFDTQRSPYFDDPRFIAMRAISFYLHWPMMLLGVLGSLLAWWKPGWLRLQGDSLLAARLVSVVVIYAIAFHMVAAPYPRYGIPFRPLIYMLAASLLAARIGAFRASRPGVTMTSATIS